MLVSYLKRLNKSCKLILCLNLKEKKERINLFDFQLILSISLIVSKYYLALFTFNNLLRGN